MNEDPLNTFGPLYIVALLKHLLETYRSLQTDRKNQQI